MLCLATGSLAGAWALARPMSLASELGSAQKLFKAGELDSAFDCCRRALKLPGGETTCGVHLVIAAIFGARDEPERAETAFSRALELDPESVPGLKGLAALLACF